MPPVDISNTFGAAYIGAIVMFILYGITSLQTYMYFVRYPKDSLSLKLLVSTVWVLDTIHIALVSHAMYHYLIINFSNPLALNDGIWTLYVSLGVNVLIGCIGQCFFTKRVHHLSEQKWWLTIVIGITVLAHFCFGMETMVEMLIKKELSRLSEITLIAAMPFAIAAVLSDVLITAALCFLLRRSKTGFKTTNTILNYLMVYAINRCILTSLVAVVEVITFAVMPHSFWFLGVDFVIGKLYANSLLAALNTRSALRGKGLNNDSNESDEDDSFNLSSLRIGSVTPSMLSRPHGTQRGGISLNFVTSELGTHDSSEDRSIPKERRRSTKSETQQSPAA